jgi:hypothetical protein
MGLIRQVCLLGILAIVGCTTVHREPAPETMFNTATPVGFESVDRYVYADPGAIESRFSARIERLRSGSKDRTLNILALSGGGAGGAFGAGALVGLGRRGERPQFDIVTGVSAGALIAPFAFLGSTWDAQLADALSGGRSEHILRSRGIGILFHPGVYRSEPLVDLVNHFVTDALIEAVARQAALGRLLLVATTDLDKEEAIIWDMGTIAAHGGEAARTLFRDVLVASASIPGVFSPVVIPVEKAGVRYDEMHVDAGATVPFFVAPALAYVLPLNAKKLKDANIYVLINGQLGSIPETTTFSTISILLRSYSTTLKQLARTELALTSEFAQKYGMNFRLAAVPIDYPFTGPLDFQESTTRALFNYGAKCAEAGQLWTTVEQSIAHSERALSAAREKRQAPEGPLVPPCPLDVSATPARTSAHPPSDH